MQIPRPAAGKTFLSQEVLLGIGFWDANLNEKQFKLPLIWSKMKMVLDPNLAGSAVKCCRKSPHSAPSSRRVS